MIFGSRDEFFLFLAALGGAVVIDGAVVALVLTNITPLGVVCSAAITGALMTSLVLLFWFFRNVWPGQDKAAAECVVVSAFRQAPHSTNPESCGDRHESKFC